MYYKENSCKGESESIDSSVVWKNIQVEAKRKQTSWIRKEPGVWGNFSENSDEEHFGFLVMNHVFNFKEAPLVAVCHYIF